MPLILSANIEAEVEAAETSVIDLIEVDLGLGFKKFWSTTNVAIDWVVTEFGTSFEPRILSMSQRSWKLGLDDDTLNLTLGNSDGAISRIAKEFGVDIFEGAKVRNHRLFASIKEIHKDYWVGEGLPMQWSEGECSWNITFGIAALKQKFGRKIEFTCPHVFAGGPSSDCPYSPEIANIGVPEPKVVATAGSGTTTSKIDGAVGLSAVSVGWIVFNRDENSYYRVTDLVDDTEIAVVFTSFGENGANRLNDGDKLFIGPPFTACAKTPEECQERGMYGKHSGNPEVEGWGTKQRYFGGSAAHSSVRFSGRLPNPNERFGHGSANRFSRTSAGNDSLEGSVIPVIFGRYVLRDVPSIFIAPAGAFQHGYFILCEGESFDFHVLGVNGSFMPDNNSHTELDTLTEILKNDSYVKWGVWFRNTSTGMNDDRAAGSPDRAKQIRQSIGQRRSVHVSSGNFVSDTYGDGFRGNPYLFSKPKGEGVSPAGTVASRIRIETQEDILSTLTADFSVTGLLVPLPAGMSLNKLEILALQFTGLNDPPGPTTLNYTVDPNPIQAAYALMRSSRWGAGIPDSKIDLPSVIAASDFCEENTQSIESAGTVLTGTVNQSSFENPGFATGTWIFTDDVFTPTRGLVNKPITFNKGTGDAFTATIIDNQFYEEIYDDNLYEFDYGTPFFICTPTGAPGNLIRIDQVFPSGKEPVASDPFEIPAGRFVTRFKANGIIGDDAPIPDILQDILDNCNGTFRNRGDKIELLIRRKLSAAEINTVISDGIFTDRGVKRNILRDGRTKVSTMKVWREDEKTLGNFFTVDFQDQERDYQTSRVVVFNDAAQAKAAKLFGDLEGRLKITSSVNLILTTSKDQAARLLALRAREIFIQNLFCSFKTSLKRGMKALPGDIIAIDSETIAAHFNMQLLRADVAIGNSFLFRVLEKSESSSYAVEFKCQVHVNPIYEGFATDFTQFFTANETLRERGSLPAPVTPLTATERIVLNSDESVRSVINVKVTYPDLGV